MVEIKITEDEGRNEYLLDPKSGFLGARYDNLSSEIKVIFPQREIDNESSCTMIITNSGEEIDCVTVRHEEVFKLHSPMSQYKQVFIGFSFQKPDGYIKNTDIGVYFFRDAQDPDAIVPTTPIQREKINLLLADGFASVDWAENSPTTLEFKNVDGEVVKRVDITGDGFASTEDLGEVLEEAKAYTDGELAKFDFIKIVQELPETGLPNRFYFVFKDDGESPDLFDEWVWVNKGTEETPDYAWEYLGTKKIEIDLTDYVKKTDLAMNNNAGLVYSPIGTWNGIGINKGIPQIIPASNGQIDNKTTSLFAIVPANLDYATMSALASCKDMSLWTDDKTENGEVVKGTKTKACETIGAVPINLPNDLTLTEEQKAKWRALLGIE